MASFLFARRFADTKLPPFQSSFSFKSLMGSPFSFAAVAHKNTVVNASILTTVDRSWSTSAGSKFAPLGSSSSLQLLKGSLFSSAAATNKNTVPKASIVTVVDRFRSSFAETDDKEDTAQASEAEVRNEKKNPVFVYYGPNLNPSRDMHRKMNVITSAFWIAYVCRFSLQKVTWHPGSDSFEVETLSWRGTCYKTKIKFEDSENDWQNGVLQHCNDKEFISKFSQHLIRN